MLVTVGGAMAVYYLWAFKLGLNENAGLAASTATALVISFLAYRLKKRAK